MAWPTRIQDHPVVRRAAAFARRHKLTAVLTLAIVASLVLTGVSLSMYYMGGFHRYDLSRPGYEKERTELARPEPQKSYDTTSPVSKQTITDFLIEFDARQSDLKAYGDYRDQALADNDLQISHSNAQ